jgi:hypothetical protein
LILIAAEMVNHQYNADPHAVPDNPAALYRELCSFQEGADWLLVKWGELRLVLAHDGRLDDYDRLKAALALGKRPGDAVFDDTVRDLFLACFAASGETWALYDIFRQAHAAGMGKPLYADLISALHQRHGYADAAAGRAALEAIVARNVAHLEALKADSLDAAADLDREVAETAALVDDTREGAARRRYETACDHDLHRALSAFLRLRKQLPPEVCGNEPIAEADQAEEVTPIEAADMRAESAPAAAAPPPETSGARSAGESVAEVIPAPEVTSTIGAPRVVATWWPVVGPAVEERDVHHRRPAPR